jgi:hypothetical protein
MRAAIQVVAALTLLSGMHVAIRMRETLIRRPATGLEGVPVLTTGEWKSDHERSNN